MSEAGGQGNQQGLESSNFQSHPLTSRKRGTEVKPITKGQWFNQSKPWSGFPVAQTIKNLPAMQETQVQSLSCEDPLQKEMATHSSILSQRIPGTKKPGELQSTVSQSQTWLSDSLSHIHTGPYIKKSPLKKKNSKTQLESFRANERVKVLGKLYTQKGHGSPLPLQHT